ncbi:MAG: hypothetical protein KAS32_28510 [Candidatus Peribacteraceae bacterium]|nr:hypothetical protein [Candidatus Peribacteraceae bacterium]
MNTNIIEEAILNKAASLLDTDKLAIQVAGAFMAGFDREITKILKDFDFGRWLDIADYVDWDAINEVVGENVTKAIIKSLKK